MATEKEAVESQQQDIAALAVDGLRRLAFGTANDAVRLVMAEEQPSPEELARLDLFCVSEIKRQKGAVEVRFFDRLKALEALLEWSRAGERDGGKTESLYAALEKSAAALKGPEQLHEV